MKRIVLLGVEVTPLTVSDLNYLLGEAISQHKRWIVANHNLHSIYIYHRDPRMREFYAKAKAVHIDGMPLVHWGRLMGYPLRSEHRVTYVDWIYPLLEKANEKRWRVFYLGGKPGVAERAAAILMTKFPDLEIRTHHGYFTPGGEENEAIIREIEQFSPNVLMVGMSMPRQERWILDNLGKISANVILPSGACFDYIAEAIPTPPRWIGQIGLEWLYRLFSEPKRLWRRYLVEPFFLLSPAWRDIVHLVGRKVQKDS